MQDKDTRFDLAGLSDDVLKLLLDGALENGGQLAKHLADVITDEMVRRAHSRAGRPTTPVIFDVPWLEGADLPEAQFSTENTRDVLDKAILASEPVQARDLLAAWQFMTAVADQLEAQRKKLAQAMSGPPN